MTILFQVLQTSSILPKKSILNHIGNELDTTDDEEALITVLNIVSFSRSDTALEMALQYLNNFIKGKDGTLNFK
jgi:hypothetical protein